MCTLSALYVIDLITIVANGEQHEVVARQPDHPSKEEGGSWEQPTCTNTAAEHGVEGVGVLSRPPTEGGRGSDEKLNLAVQESTNVGGTRSDLVSFNAKQFAAHLKTIHLTAMSVLHKVSLILLASFYHVYNLIIINETHISLSRIYSFSFGRNVMKRGRIMKRCTVGNLAKPKFSLRSFCQSSCHFYGRRHI